MIFLETERACLRQWVSDDWTQLRALAQDPRVMQHIENGDLWPDDRIRRFVDGGIAASQTRGWILWPVIYKADSQFIGICGFNAAFAPEVEIGWWLRPEYWRQGIATEVAAAVMDYGFRTWSFPRLISVTAPANHASIRVMKKLGMHYDRAFEHNGTPVIAYAKSNPLAE